MSRRSLVLIAVLLVLLGVFAGRAVWQAPLLSGENSISNVVVKQADDGQWQVSFDYYSRGEEAWIDADIDNKDNDRFNALAYAVQKEEMAIARRLLRLGAKPSTPVGYGDVPVALMPVMAGNLELIKLMREFGVDYAKLSYEGATAFDFAKQTGDPELLKALEPTPRAL